MSPARGLFRLYKRGDSWRVDGSIGGERHRRDFRTKEEADTYRRLCNARKTAAAVKRSGAIPRLDVTCSEAEQALLDWWDGRGLSERTLDSYRQELGWLLAWWGDVRVAEITPALMDRYQAECRRAGLSASAIRHRMDRLSQLLRVAEREGWIDRAPRVERPPIGGTERTPLPLPDEEQLLAAAAAPADRVLVLLARDAGLRREEISRVQPADVERRPWDGACCGWVHVRGKGGRDRDVPILTRRLREALRLAPPPWPWGTASGVDKAARRISAAAGLGDHSPLHRLRHAFVTRVREAGEVGVISMQWVGHGDTRTHDRYTHARLRPTLDLRKAVAPPKRSQNSPTAR